MSLSSYRLIDTQLPPGFTVQKFESIKPGMTKAEVSKILPAPMYKSDDGGSWHYGQDGAAPFGDFAWFDFKIHFDAEGKVIKTERQKFND
ncbi:hypothetical protein ACQFX9_27600 [Aliinostoc sp. HNIBRCY26]|uniref:hypothetical protein n=1 Tax=Aliinostoc sp. HNIBRCY26 TaxID=3418997 RepID=UPI003D014F11